MSYRVRFDKAAERDLDQLAGKTWEKVQSKIASLQENPRPQGCLKLSGFDDAWRVRVAEIRILYEIDDRARIVTITRVRHGKDAYR